MKISNDKRFQVGRRHTVIALYGGWETIRIVARDCNTVKYEHMDDMGNYKTANIIVKEGIEMIEAWEYKGHKSYYSANSYEDFEIVD